MALITNPEGHATAMRMAQTVKLFGLQNKMLSRLQDADYRHALMLCRRALACEEQMSYEQDNAQTSESTRYRRPLLDLLAVLNRLRVEVRTRRPR